MILVTGAAGFIGSHLVERLLDDDEKVRGFDNLSTGKAENLATAIKRSNFEFVQSDCLNVDDVRKSLTGIKHVFHLAADPEVRRGVADPNTQFRQNVIGTQTLLEEIRRNGSIDTFVLMSTSTVYGNAKKLPTPEDYGPLCPISTYGATKLACEALAASYADSYRFRAIILRLANIVGSRSSHGVIHDFIAKIGSEPHKLEVLGDGQQTKSYLHVSDCVDAIATAWRRSDGEVAIFNVGSKDCVNVASIANIVVREMRTNAEIEFAGGTPEGAGWVGDVKKMWLDISRLKEFGWSSSRNSKESVTLAIRELLGK